MARRETGPDQRMKPVRPGVEVSVSVPDETFRARREFGLVKHAPAWSQAPEGRIALSSAASPPGDREGKGVDEHLLPRRGEIRDGVEMQARATPEHFSKGGGELLPPGEAGEPGRRELHPLRHVHNVKC